MHGGLIGFCLFLLFDKGVDRITDPRTEKVYDALTADRVSISLIIFPSFSN